MGGTYGSTRAQALIRQGQYDEAIATATADFATDGANPEHLVDRAQAASALGRHVDAARDLEAALALDEDAAVLDTDLVDDALFSALLAAARAAASPDEGVRLLERYRAVMPDGAHGTDVAEWTKRLRGAVRTEWVKERD